jgi:hypothetical protein
MEGEIVERQIALLKNGDTIACPRPDQPGVAGRTSDRDRL